MFLDLAKYPASSASLMDPYKPGIASSLQALSSKSTAPGNFQVFSLLFSSSFRPVILLAGDHQLNQLFTTESSTLLLHYVLTAGLASTRVYHVPLSEILIYWSS